MRSLRDILAEIQHEIWSHWMTYLFSCCIQSSDGSFIIPKDKVDRWHRQMNTSYLDLSDKEKQSDLHQADKVLKVINF